MPEEIECFDPDPINLKAKQIWEEESSKTSGIKTEYAPMIYPFLKKKAILFVGLNPSFSEKGNRLILKDSEYQIF